MNETFVLLTITAAFSGLFAYLGRAIHHNKRYDFIAGYNTEPEETQQQYDIEGLAKHLHDGLMTIAVLAMLSVVLLIFELPTLSAICIGLLTFVALLIPIGARKFMPHRQRLLKEAPGDAAHPFLLWLLPEKTFRKLESDTRQWLIECAKCGHKRDFWEAGGVRSGASGNPKNYNHCPKCQQWSWQTIRKKTAQEQSEI